MASPSRANKNRDLRLRSARHGSRREKMDRWTAFSAMVYPQPIHVELRVSRCSLRRSVDEHNPMKDKPRKASFPNRNDFPCYARRIFRDKGMGADQSGFGCRFAGRNPLSHRQTCLAGQARFRRFNGLRCFLDIFLTLCTDNRNLISPVGRLKGVYAYEFSFLRVR